MTSIHSRYPRAVSSTSFEAAEGALATQWERSSSPVFDIDTWGCISTCLLAGEETVRRGNAADAEVHGPKRQQAAAVAWEITFAGALCRSVA